MAVTPNRFADLNVALIIPNGRSGSVLLQTLFDGHPDLISFPSFHTRYDYRNPDARSLSDHLDHLVEAHPYLFDTRSSYFGQAGYATTALLGDNGDIHAAVNSIAFRECARTIAEQYQLGTCGQLISRRDFFCLVHLALAQAIGQNPDRIKCIIFHLHDYYQDALAEISQDFPSLRFLPTIRDPRESNYSWKRVLQLREGTEAIPHMFLDSILMDRRVWQDYFSFARQIPADRLLPVDLNDLHRRQTEALHEIADFLSVDYHEVLTSSTVLGFTWWGNAADRKPITGLDAKKSLYTYANGLNSREIELVEQILSFPIRHFGYARAAHPFSRLRLLMLIFASPAMLFGDLHPPGPIRIDSASKWRAQTSSPPDGPQAAVSPIRQLARQVKSAYWIQTGIRDALPRWRSLCKLLLAGENIAGGSGA